MAVILVAYLMRYVQTALLFFVLFLPSVATANAVGDLPDAEQSYYLQMFDYAMNYKQEGEQQEWKTQHGNGSFTLKDRFTSKSGYDCRNFRETMDILGNKTSRNGVGCKRQGRDGWCKLKPSNAMTCALEEPSTIFDKGVPTMETGDSFKDTANAGTGRFTRWLKNFLQSF